MNGWIVGIWSWSRNNPVGSESPAPDACAEIGSHFDVVLKSDSKILGQCLLHHLISGRNFWRFLVL